MPVTIKIKEEPPRELIRVIEEYYGTVDTIKEVLIDTGIENLSKEALAAFNPKTGQVVLDLGRCLDANKWLDKGLMRIQAVWFNMLRAVYHEGTHAEQLRDYPELIKKKVLPAKYEEEAEIEALFQICAWAEKGGISPKLDDMGWCGKQLKAMINRFYANEKMRGLLMQELEALESNAVADVETFIHDKGEFSNEGLKELYAAIDRKDIGLKVKGVRYLDPLGFFGYFLEEIDTKVKTNICSKLEKEEKRAKTAQDRAEE